jgi:hypothetical protein
VAVDKAQEQAVAATLQQVQQILVVVEVVELVAH